MLIFLFVTLKIIHIRQIYWSIYGVYNILRRKLCHTYSCLYVKAPKKNPTSIKLLDSAMETFLTQLYSTTIAGLFAILLVLYYLSTRISKKNVAPEAGDAWPIIGHLHLLGGSKLPHLVFGSMADKYGPIFTVRLGVQRSLVVSSWEMMKEIFTTNDVIVSGRPKFLAAKHLSYNYAMFGFSPYGSFWVELRKITTLQLLSNRRLELLKHVRVSEMEISMRQLYKLWSEKKNGSGRVLVDMKKWFGELNLNVTLRVVFGKRYVGGGAASNDEEARRCRRVMREFFRLLGVVVVADSLPFLRWLDLGGYERAMKKTAREMDSIVSGWLEEHRIKSDSSGEANMEQDFMDVMLSAVKNIDLCGFDADTVIKATCMVGILTSLNLNKTSNSSSSIISIIKHN